MMKTLLPLMLLLAACATTDEKKPDYTITFHAQASDMDPPKTMFPFDLNGKRMFFKVVPEFSQQNIIAFHPFPSDAGNGSGAVLQLDFRGKAQLEIITRTRKDEQLLALVNARPVDTVVLDQPVFDGIVTVWHGLSDEVVKKMDKHIPRMRKGGAAPTASDRMEMDPTTKGEKVRAYEAAKAAEKAAASGALPKKVQSLDTPAAPVTPKIPVEGVPPPPSPAIRSFDAPPSPLPPLPPSPYPRTSASGESTLPKP